MFCPKTEKHTLTSGRKYGQRRRRGGARRGGQRRFTGAAAGLYELRDREGPVRQVFAVFSRHYPRRPAPLRPSFSKPIRPFSIPTK